MMDCVVSTPEQYVELAVGLGTDLDYRAHVSRRILDRSPRLFEDWDAVVEMEEFFQQAVTTSLGAHEP